jgi:hypothetical protein
MKSLKTSTVFALSTLLVACGGGGGGGGGTDPNSNSNGGAKANLVTSSVTGVDVAYVRRGTGFATPDSNPVSRTPVAKEPIFSGVSSLGKFTLNDSSGSVNSQFVFDTTKISSVDIFNGIASEGKTTFNLGGTDWAHTRFGMIHNFAGTDVSGLTTIRHTPFFVADASSTPATLTNATYVGYGSATGTFITVDREVAGIVCSVSAAYTQSSEMLEVTLKDCHLPNAFGVLMEAPVTGTIQLLRPAGTFLNRSTLNGFSIAYGDPLTGSAVASSDYKFGGPKGEEVVGAATVIGVSGPTYGMFTFAFGAKK